jgi:biotin carboxylase
MSATLLFIGAGRSQRTAIRRARELGARVVAVDGDARAPALGEADVAQVVDFSATERVVEVGRRHRVDGVLTVASDRAVPAVAAIAAELGLPGIGVDVAERMTNKLAMRRRLAEAGIPQPRFACARTYDEALAALDSVGVPAVLKPADSGGQRGLVRLAARSSLDGHVAAALRFSRSGETIVERFHDGTELNGILVLRDGRPEVVTLSDRLRPPGPGFGVGWIHRYPSELPDGLVERVGEVAAAAAVALGLSDGIAFPQVLVTAEGEALVVEVAARIGAGQMNDLVRLATGVDLVEIAVLQALGRPVPDELVRPRFRQPLAIRFLTAEPGPLRAGKVLGVHGLELARQAEGVVQAELYFGPGETIRPLLVDDDRRGYVIAVGETAAEALERAEAAARLVTVDVE